MFLHLLLSVSPRSISLSESQTRRLIVRASDTENLIRIMVEAFTQELCRFDVFTAGGCPPAT